MVKFPSLRMSEMSLFGHGCELPVLASVYLLEAEGLMENQQRSLPIYIILWMQYAFSGGVSIGREKNLKLACTTIKQTKVCLSPGISYLHRLVLKASSKNSFRLFSVTVLHFSHMTSALFRYSADLGLCSRKGNVVKTMFWFISSTQVSEESFVGRKEV